MPYNLTVHYDNALGFAQPRLWVWYRASAQPPGDFAPTSQDTFGPIFQVQVERPEFEFKFKDGPGGLPVRWEPDSVNRRYEPLELIGTHGLNPGEIWVRASRAFVYPVELRQPESQSAAQFVSALQPKPGIYLPDTDGRHGLGATPLTDGRLLFGLYHPNAARVYVIGSFNNWQRPGADNEDPSQFIECQRYRGYFGDANTWLVVTGIAQPGDEYKFFVIGGVPRDRHRRPQQFFPDPYARQLGPHYGFNNSVICDASTFVWNEGNWSGTPDIGDLILYEMSIYGFTEGDADIQPAHRGRFAGVTERIEAGYFERLGVNALSIMPLAEVPGHQGPGALGYATSLFCAVERDFGAPDDLRRLVAAAHRHGLAVLLDEVFNHTSNDVNPLWKMVLEHPDEEANALEGGLYFNGATRWGNRVATEKRDVQNLLIDTCKLLISEYRVDGFRFDATHTDYMDHGFLLRLAAEIKAFKPSVLLVCENLPNQGDLNRSGFDGFAQWCDPFHDKMKALLREGVFQDSNFPTPDGLGNIFFFARDSFAAHTNNVVNYCVSHDENTVPYEVRTNPALNQPATKERKGRLGFFATMVALGQPMIYMGQEFNQEQERNIVTVHWPGNLNNHGFFQWASRLVRLRRRYPGLRLRGYNPAGTGQFAWVIAPWMEERRGGGRKVIGWRSRVNPAPHEALVVLLNFEGYDVRVDVEFGLSGTWVKLADIDRVNDIAPEGSNSAQEPTALRTRDGWFAHFTLPSSSGFLYKWENADA